MPGPMENRAAVFTSSPQDVEVYRDGSWWPGSMLGWRHDAAGDCEAWVRASVRGVEETAWLALACLRLPEPEPAVVQVQQAPVLGVSASPAETALTGTIAAIRAVPMPTRGQAARREISELTATMNLVAVRDLSGTDAARPVSSPVSSPVTSSVAAPAPTTVPAVAAQPARTGGRRRAPATDEIEFPAPAATDRAAVPGRHRAPSPAAGAAGRHRAADTGVWPAVRDEAPAIPARWAESGPSTGGEESDAHLFTRPMRLGDLVGGPGAGGVPQPRRASAREGRLSGV